MQDFYFITESAVVVFGPTRTLVALTEAQTSEYFFHQTDLGEVLEILRKGVHEDQIRTAGSVYDLVEISEETGLGLMNDLGVDLYYEVEDNEEYQDEEEDVENDYVDSGWGPLRDPVTGRFVKRS